MESGDETGGNFNQSKLVNEREHKERAARHGGGQTQGYCKNVAKHVRFGRFSRALYSLLQFLPADATPGPENHFIVAEARFRKRDSIGIREIFIQDDIPDFLTRRR